MEYDQRWNMSNPGKKGALDGVKVVDLSRVLGGPYCTQILGDHGADIIKIEPPFGDETRHWGESKHDRGSPYFIGANRNKRSIGLDLSCEQGRGLLLKFLEGADVLVDNFKPGTLEKWQLGFESDLKHRFPKLIHCSVSGFGPDGPLGGFPGYDAIAQAMVGMMSINGDEASGTTRVGLPIVDLATGLYAVIGILMALHERASSNRGQHIDVSLFDSGLAIMHPHAANYQYGGKMPGLTGSAHPNISPYDKYRCRDGEIFIGAGNDRAFRRLCAELDATELADDSRFKNNVARVKNRGLLTDALNIHLVTRDCETLSLQLLRAGIAAGPVWNTQQALDHAHTQYREMIVADDWYQGIGTPLKLSRSSSTVRFLPPKLGQDSRDLLRENGCDEDEVTALISSGVVIDGSE